MSAQQRILGELDAVNLQNQGRLSPNDSRGTRRLHRRYLNRSSDEENQHIPLDVPMQSAAANEAFVSIPEHLISQATLEYVGFSEAKAAAMWQQWTNWPSGGPLREVDSDDGGLRMTFLDFLTGPFNGSVDCSSENDQEWSRCMNDFGLNSQTQDAILDPRFKYLRLSRSCAFWAKDTVEMRYAGLQDIQRASLERELALTSGSHQPGAPRQEQPRGKGQQGGTPTQSSGRIIVPQGPSISETPLITANSAQAIAARNAPGHTVLYKGMDKARINGLLDENGSLNQLGVILSSPPSDFSGSRALFYFTPDYKVAQYYAAYAKRRAIVESVVIICVWIPNNAIEVLQPPVIQRLYWPSTEWKELVWTCRTARALPKPLRKYRQATLVIGTISRKPNDSYHQLPSSEHINESFILKVDGETGGQPAVQYVFSGEEEGRELLEDSISQIKVYPFVSSELDTWMEV